jgi:hypothetical protein
MRGFANLCRAGLAAFITVGLPANAAHAGEPRIRDLRVAMQGAEIQVQGRLEDPDGWVAVVELYVRAFEQPYRKESTVLKDGVFSATLPTAALLQGASSAKLGYYLIGRNASGSPILSRGSADAPISVILTELVTPADLRALEAPLNGPTTPSSTAPTAVASPWYARWWVWTVMGVLVVGGATTAIVLTRH